MKSTLEPKKETVFQRTSINGMSLMAKEIAAMLEKAGYIKITDVSAGDVR